MGLVERILTEDLTFDEFDEAIDDARALLRNDHTTVLSIADDLHARVVDHLERYASSHESTIQAGWSIAARYAEAGSVAALLNEEPERAIERAQLSKMHHHRRLRIRKSMLARTLHDLENYGIGDESERRAREHEFYWFAMASLDRAEAGIKTGVLRAAPHEPIRNHLSGASYGSLIKDPLDFSPLKAFDSDDAEAHITAARKVFVNSRSKKSNRQLKLVQDAEWAVSFYSSL